MPDAIDTQAVEHTARELLDARINAVRELAKAQVAVDHAREELGEAETNHAAVYAAAARAGWSDAELKKMGLTTPSRRAPGRPRRTRPGGARPATAGASEGPSASTAGEADDVANGG